MFAKIRRTFNEMTHEEEVLSAYVLGVIIGVGSMAAVSKLSLNGQVVHNVNHIYIPDHVWKAMERSGKPLVACFDDGLDLVMQIIPDKKV